MTYPQFEGYSPRRPPDPPHPISTTVINSPFKGADTPKCQPKWGHFNQSCHTDRGEGCPTFIQPAEFSVRRPFGPSQ